LPRDRARDWPASDGRQVRRGVEPPVLFGAVTVDPASRAVYNSAVLFDAAGELRGRFDKNILIVFGEYVPFFDQLPFITRWVPEVSNLARGTDVAVFPFESRAGSVRISPMICYEDIHPSFGRRVAAQHPNVLVNLTNDTWFGRTSEPWQHLALSVFRAVEMRLDLVRAVNSGVSAFVDSTGRVYATSRVVEPGPTVASQPDTLLERVAIQQTHTLYATLGEWLGTLCIAATLLLLVQRRRHRTRAAER
jgi:apolipoprotein N-acyltransferase